MKNSRGTDWGISVACGLAPGVALGYAMDNVGLGIAFGLGFGAAIGLVSAGIQRKKGKVPGTSASNRDHPAGG